MSTPGTTNAPPLVIDRQQTTGNTRAYCHACSRPALDTVHALLRWSPDSVTARADHSGKGRATVQDWTPRHRCPGCGQQMLAEILCADCVARPTEAVSTPPAGAAG